jgi:3-polyprenyl-4-hydroxybenzoate decarboxylase
MIAESRDQFTLVTLGPSDVLDHAASEIASGSKRGIDAMQKM